MIFLRVFRVTTFLTNLKLSLSVEAARFRLLLTSGLHLLVIFNTTVNKIFFDEETFNN